MSRHALPEKMMRGDVMWAVLGVIGVVSVVIVGALCPGILKLMSPIARRRYSSSSIRKAVYRLDKKGWIVLKQRGNAWRVGLSARGRQEVEAYELGRKKIDKPKRWDKKWRVLVFDIQERHRWIRDSLRGTLRMLGFIRIQDSVWVHPYDCRFVLELLRTKYNIRTEALYLLVETIDHDQRLRKEFELGNTGIQSGTIPHGRE